MSAPPLSSDPSAQHHVIRPHRRALLTVVVAALLSGLFLRAAAVRGDHDILDFGDAPPSYPVTLGQNGARHVIGVVQLGATVDAEPDGQPSRLAMADGNPDEDGVHFGGLFRGAPPAQNVIQVSAGLANGMVSAWIDWNRDGTWDNTERIMRNVPVLAAGPHNEYVTVPPGAKLGITYARFRIYPDSGNTVSVTGTITGGEVEDYATRICDAPAPPTCCVHTMLVIDTSRSMNDKNRIADARAATALVNLTLMPPSGFGLQGADGGALPPIVPLTSSRKTVVDAINKLAARNQESDYAAAINAVQAQLAANPDPACNNTIVLVGDGRLGHQEQTNSATAATAAKNAGTRIIVVGVKADSLDVPFLTGLASSPADYYQIKKSKDAQPIFQSLVWSQCDAPANTCPPVNEATGGEPDLGDAPDSSNHFDTAMHAYQPAATLGRFPTVYDLATGAAPGPQHLDPTADIWLGEGVTRENDADLMPDEDGFPNLDPPKDVADADDADDGVHFPVSIPACGSTTITLDVTVASGPNQRYANAWFDWNRDGDWSDVFQCTDANQQLITVPEWALRDLVLNLGPGVHTVQSPPFPTFDTGDGSPMWLRITVSDAPAAPPGDGRGPVGGFAYGETEDYLISAQPGSGHYEPGVEP